MCEEFRCKARAKGKHVFTLPSRSPKWSILFSEEKEDYSQSQDLKQNLTIVSEAANFAKYAYHCADWKKIFDAICKSGNII